MRKDYEHIEEKLVPYLEGVLNQKERREVDEAINSDGELAREMSELRDVILELRQSFASGMKPPQEELGVEEVVELGANTGSVDTLPGTSQQKARLFCSDQALEEYSLLRALQEEMARTTLDRDNIPEMPEALRKEFLAVKSAAGARPKVLPFKKSALSPAPVWRRASRLLDRIDPKPLMASAAALVMLSLGVHLYQNPRSTVGGTAPAEIGYSFPEGTETSAKGQAGAAASASPPPGLATTANAGVAVFNSDDRELLKEQAEKLLANKVRYTVTKDRILVADKDVKMARDILWAETDGKTVAMAKEATSTSRMTRPERAGRSSAGYASSGANSEPAASYSSQASGSVPASAPVVQADAELAAASRSGADDVVFSPPQRTDAPSPPRAARPAYMPPSRPATAPRIEASMGTDPDPYDRRAEREPKAEADVSSALKPKRSAPRAGSAAGYSPDDGVVRPSEVDLSSSAAGAVRSSKDSSPPLPAPVAIGEARVKPSASSSATSAERRNKLREMAIGDGADIAPSDEPTATNAPASSSQSQQTITQNRARVASQAPSVPATAPVPNVVTASDATAPAAEEQSQADGRIARMESSRQEVAQKHAVELSFSSKNGKVEVYVRPKKALTKAELEALRKTLRKELSLADSDTIIFR